MKNSITVMLMVLLAGSQWECTSTTTQGTKNVLLVQFNEVYDFENLRQGDIADATEVVLKNAEEILQKILRVDKKDRTFENTLEKIDDIYATIEMVWSPGYLMSSTHTDEKIRDEGLESSRKIEKYMTDLALNKDLYNAVLDYSATDEGENLIEYKKKFLDDTIRDFRRSGLALSDEKRNKVKALFNSLSDLGLAFSKNIADYQDTLFLSEDEMKGLPKVYKMERLQKDGRYAVDMSYPSIGPYFKLAESDRSRKELRFRYNNRAKESNLEILDDIIRKRGQLSTLLGYRSYAEYRTEDRMAKTPENVWAFEKDLITKVRKKAEADVGIMLKIKSERNKEVATKIGPWEASYYENLVLKKDFDLDSEEVKKYFEFNNVTQGLFTIYQTLFNIRFKEVKDPSVWHDDVLMYEVFDGSTDELIGSFYLDMFPRANKYSHAAAFSVTMGKMTRNGYQRPATALVCNFPKPSDLEPSLLTHDNVETYFHEFGHLVHGVLTRAPLMSYAGTSVARDFVEAPSQMLENWVWQKGPLSLFAQHYQTGETIPDSLLDKMVAAKNVNSGTKALQQIFYGVLDLTLHDGYDPDKDGSTTEIVERLQNELTLYPFQSGTHMQAAFGHLNGYGSAYYGYKWSEVYAHDMFSIFEQNGIMDARTGMRYREIILEKGGTEEALDLVKEFLGREPNNKAFLKSMGL